MKRGVDGLSLIILVFYLLIWIINPSNKVIVVLSFLLLCFVYLNEKNLKNSLLITYIVLSIINTGKRYDITVIPPGVFPREFYPLGYYVSIVITPSMLLVGFMAIHIFREWTKTAVRFNNIIIVDLLLICVYLYKLLSDFIVSPMKDLAFGLWASSLSLPVVYLYIRLFFTHRKKALSAIFTTITLLVFIESVIAGIQFVRASPAGKTIELAAGIESFGEAADEYIYRFRPIGTFDHANILAAYIATNIPLIICSLFLKRHTKKLLALLSGFIAIALTISRSAWIGLSIGLLWQSNYIYSILSLASSKLHTITRLVLIGLFMSIVTVVVLPRVYSSLYSLTESGGAFTRKVQMSTATRLILQSPILGVGTAMYVPRALEIDETQLTKYFPSPVHNRYFLLAAENGIPALILYIAFIASSVVVLYRATHTRKLEHIWKTHAAVISVVLVVGLFQPYNFFGTVAICFALLYSYVNANKNPTT